MEGRGNLFLFFMARFQNFPILVIFGTAADFTMSDPFFPEIGIFGSSWDCRKFYGEIDFDRKRTSIFWKKCKQLEKLGNCGAAQENFRRSYKDSLRAGADKISILWKRALNSYFAFSSNSCYTIYRRLGKKLKKVGKLGTMERSPPLHPSKKFEVS